MKIYCCKCNKEVDAVKITGSQAYPHREDLSYMKFWQCPTCLNFVGCHSSGKPLGNIATKEIKRARQHIHKLIDPLWKNRKIGRSALYKKISSILGYEYHTALIKSIDEARQVYKIALDIKKELKK